MKVILCIGSNCGNKIESVRKGVEWLSELLKDLKKSDIYLSAAIGKSKDEYANCVVCGEYPDSPESLIRLCKDYEKKAGRNEESRSKGEVPLDIDLVIGNNKIYKAWDIRQNFFLEGFNQLKIYEESEEPVLMAGSSEIQ